LAQSLADRLCPWASIAAPIVHSPFLLTEVGRAVITLGPAGGSRRVKHRARFPGAWWLTPTTDRPFKMPSYARPGGSGRGGQSGRRRRCCWRRSLATVLGIAAQTRRTDPNCSPSRPSRWRWTRASFHKRALAPSSLGADATEWQHTGANAGAKPGRIGPRIVDTSSLSAL